MRNLIIAIEQEIKRGKTISEAIKTIAIKNGLAIDGITVKYLYERFKEV